MAVEVTCEKCAKVFRVPARAKDSPIHHDCKPQAHVAPVGVGGHLLILFRVVKLFLGGKCDDCDAYAKKLDVWGPDQCEERAEEIVAHLVQQADEKVILSRLVPGATKEATARKALEEAIRRTRASLERRLEYISQRRMVSDLDAIIRQLPPDVSGIVGVPRSGMVPASHLACRLHLPLYALTDRGLFDLGHGYRLNDAARVGPLCVVDDTIQTGWSIKRAQKRWKKLGLPQALWAACYVTSAGLALIDYHARLLPAPHYLEWNLFNSLLMPEVATDFDGVLCHDLPAGADREEATYREAIERAAPLHLPRRQSIPLVVTARPEAMRNATLEWLARWGLKATRLAMWQGGARTPQAVAAWKAEEYDKSGLQLFVESDATIARGMNAVCGKPVLCPAKETIYQ